MKVREVKTLITFDDGSRAEIVKNEQEGTIDTYYANGPRGKFLFAYGVPLDYWRKEKDPVHPIVLAINNVEYFLKAQKEESK